VRQRLACLEGKSAKREYDASGARDQSRSGGRSVQSANSAFRRYDLLAAAVIAVGLSLPAAADPIPAGWEASNMEPVGYSSVGDRKGAIQNGDQESEWPLVHVS
jgi:hypothetical protein